MDEQVKARLIGATILVVVAVVLVPELLSGPRRQGANDADASGKRGTRTYTIDLSGGAQGNTAAQPKPAVEQPEKDTRLPTVAPPGAAAEETPQPVATAPAQDEVKPGAAPVVETVAEPASKPAPAAKPAATPVAAPPAKPAVTAKGGWAVQVGAFGSADTARKLVADLQRDGYSAYVAPLTRGGKTLHRVRVGPQPVRADADKLASRLKAKGLPASVVAAD